MSRKYAESVVKNLGECVEKIDGLIDGELANNNFEAVATMKEMRGRWEEKITEAEKRLSEAD